MLLAEHGQLHGLLNKAFLALAISDIATIVVFNLVEGVNFTFAHMLFLLEITLSANNIYLYLIIRSHPFKLPSN